MPNQSALRSGESLWRGIGPAPQHYPSLATDIDADVLVIGAGITGTLVSHLLIRAGIETVLIDQGAVGAGSTASSTGLLMYETDTSLVDLITQVGESAAVRAYRRGLEAVASLGKLAGELIDDCHFQQRSTLQLASRPEHFSSLIREHECLQSFGFDVTLLDAHLLSHTYGLTAYGALQSRGDAEVDPYRFTQSLVHSSQSLGLRVFGDSCVLDVSDNGSTISVKTAQAQIRARHVIYATGYFARPSFIAPSSRLQTTYVVASQPLGAIAQWPDDCLIWDTASPYLYLRRTADGRVIIGGEDTPFADDHKNDELIRSKARRLRERFQHLFPGTEFHPDYAWAGTFADTVDGLPFIGRVPDHRHQYLALGYGGNGITFSMIAAELIRDLIMGRPNEDEQVFRFGR